MCKIIAITNRHLCWQTYETQIEAICQSGVDAIIVREKDLNEEQYNCLFQKVKKICDAYQVLCIAHSFPQKNCANLHMPLFLLRNMSKEQKQAFQQLGTSCHSVEDAKEAYALGCTYIVAGHIFPTECKKGIPAKGVDFLKEIQQSVPITVYAIGGINETTIRNLQNPHVCIMSGFMQCRDVKTYMKKLRNEE